VISGSPAEQRWALLFWILRRKPAAPPGSKMLNSNAGVAMAAAMLEQVTGESWESTIQKKLFQPLQIRGGFNWPAVDEPNQPWGHLQSGKSFKPHDPHDSYHVMQYLAPAGAAQVSIGDYGRFLQMHLQGLSGKDTLVKADTMRYLHTPVGGAALGWGVGNKDGVEVHGHSGSAGTFFVITRMWPARGLAIAVVTNAGGDQAAQACKDALDALYLRHTTLRNP
jgi:CubicO group peptidase (beta-lactamase class C family)